MKKAVSFLLGSFMSLSLITGCANEIHDTPVETTTSPTTSVTKETTPPETTTATETEKPIETTKESKPSKTHPEGEIILPTAASKENPVPVGTWTAVPVRAPGQTNIGYVRITDKITDQEEIQALFDKYLEITKKESMPSLGDEEPYLEYVVVEYQVFFPANYSSSELIAFSGVTFECSNNQSKWIAEDGTKLKSLGTVLNVEAPFRPSEWPQNGDTVTCKAAFPMMKGYTDYTLMYKEKTMDGFGEFTVHFAVE
jgi:hypothetical protein